MKREFKVKCAICGYEDKHTGKFQLWRHIKNCHNITTEEYFNKYIKEDTDNDGICKLPGCNNKTRFKGLDGGYVGCCCRNHQLKLAWSNDPGYVRHDNQSKMGKVSLSDYNNKFWNDPNVKFAKSKMDLNLLLNKFKGPLLFYCMLTNAGDIKIGVASGLSSIDRKFNKYSGIKDKYFIYLGDGEVVANLEYQIKITYDQTRGLEYFDASLYDEFENLAKELNLEFVKSA